MRKLLPALGLLLAGCAIFPRPSDWKRCRFEVESVRFDGFRENQSQWNLGLEIHNPNSKRLRLEGLRIFALNGADTLASARNVQSLDLPPEDSSSVNIALELPIDSWRKVLGAGGRKSRVTVVGDAFYRSFFGVHTIPGAFKKEYEVDLAAAMGAMGGGLLQGLFSP